MNYTYQVINHFRAKKKCMINFKMFPSGTVHLGISNLEETKQYLYDCNSIEELDERLQREVKLTTVSDTVKKAVQLPSPFPKPPGLPKI